MCDYCERVEFETKKEIRLLENGLNVFRQIRLGLAVGICFISTAMNTRGISVITEQSRLSVSVRIVERI